MTKVQDKAISAFVTDVRAALEGQDPTVIADLTDNLEADLMDRQASETDAFQLGNPKLFAQELLASAGLLSVSSADSRAMRFWRGVGSAVWRFLKSVRPAWWVFRGLMAYTLIWFVLLQQEKYIPDNPGAWLALAVMVVLSVQIGRANSRNLAIRLPLAVLNIVAVLVAGYWLVGFNQVRDNYQRMNVLFNSGLLLQDGRVVGFAYAYDKNGKQLPMAALKDGNGHLIYQPPASTDLPPALAATVGTALPNALASLAKLGAIVEISYQDLPEVQSGHVASVQVSYDALGSQHVQLVVAK